MIVLGIPSARSIWLVIHPFARFWRRLGPLVPYPVVTAYASLVAYGLYQFRDVFLQWDFGLSATLSAVGFAIYLVTVYIEAQWRATSLADDSLRPARDFLEA